MVVLTGWSCYSDYRCLFHRCGTPVEEGGVFCDEVVTVEWSVLNIDGLFLYR